MSAGLLALLTVVLVDLHVRRSADATGGLGGRCTVTPDHTEFESRQGSIRIVATAVTEVRTTPDSRLVWAAGYPPVGCGGTPSPRPTPLPSTRCWLVTRRTAA